MEIINEIRFDEYDLESLAIRNFNNMYYGLCNRIYENNFDISRLDVIEFLFDYVSGKTEYFYGIDIKIVKAKKNSRRI